MHKYISFITGHMGFTLALEHSLQLVDPTVSARGSPLRHPPNVTVRIASSWWSDRRRPDHGSVPRFAHVTVSFSLRGPDTRDSLRPTRWFGRPTLARVFHGRSSSWGVYGEFFQFHRAAPSCRAAARAHARASFPPVSHSTRRCAGERRVLGLRRGLGAARRDARDAPLRDLRAGVVRRARLGPRRRRRRELARARHARVAPLRRAPAPAQLHRGRAQLVRLRDAGQWSAVATAPPPPTLPPKGEPRRLRSPRSCASRERRAVWKHGGRIDRGPNHITGANSLCTAATAPQVYNQDASPFVTRAGAVCGSNETTNALGGGFPTCETVRWVLNASSLYDLYFRLDSGLHGGEYGLHLQARSRAVARRW